MITTGSSPNTTPSTDSGMNSGVKSGMMRLLTEQEVDCFCEQRREYKTWQEYVEFAQDVYGPHAYTIEVETYEDYDDQAYFSRVGDITVYDAQGNQLRADLSTEWWQGQLADLRQQPYYAAALGLMPAAPSLPITPAAPTTPILEEESEGKDEDAGEVAGEGEDGDEEYDVEGDPDDLIYNYKAELLPVDDTFCVDKPPKRTYTQVFVPVGDPVSDPVGDHTGDHTGDSTGDTAGQSTLETAGDPKGEALPW